MGEKGNLAADNPLSNLEGVDLDVLKGSPETVNAWMDTYLKYREVQELRRAAEAAEESADAAKAPGQPDGDATVT